MHKQMGCLEHLCTDYTTKTLQECLTCFKTGFCRHTLALCPQKSNILFQNASARLKDQIIKSVTNIPANVLARLGLMVRSVVNAMKNSLDTHIVKVKFKYSEKAKKFCEIFSLLLSYVVPVKSKVEISQNFVAFSEYMNFTWYNLYLRGFD